MPDGGLVSVCSSVEGRISVNLTLNFNCSFVTTMHTTLRSCSGEVIFIDRTMHFHMIPIAERRVNIMVVVLWLLCMGEDNAIFYARHHSLG